MSPEANLLSHLTKDVLSRREQQNFGRRHAGIVKAVEVMPFVMASRTAGCAHCQGHKAARHHLFQQFITTWRSRIGDRSKTSPVSPIAVARRSSLR